jgi:hypothetical protein
VQALGGGINRCRWSSLIFFRQFNLCRERL